MQWSQLRKQLGDRLAPSLAKRVDFHFARYRHSHDELGRAWITLDGEEVVDLSDHRFQNEYYPLAQAIRERSGATDFRDPEQRAEYHAAYDAAREITTAEGTFAGWDFTGAARRFLSLSIDDALASDDPLIRALAMLDRRVGKQRLRKISKDRAENPVVLKLLRIRCEAEGLRFAAP
jgi:predicted NACHT family NTPase